MSDALDILLEYRRFAVLLLLQIITLLVAEPDAKKFEEAIKKINALHIATTDAMDRYRKVLKYRVNVHLP